MQEQSFQATCSATLAEMPSSENALKSETLSPECTEAPNPESSNTQQQKGVLNPKAENAQVANAKSSVKP